ncbi:hypothetical protein RFI_29165, partial [Reticulomyxa filosa]
MSPSRGVLSETDYKLIFPHDIVVIQQFNCELLSNFEAIYKHFDNNTSLLGPQMNFFIPYLKMYQSYINNHSRAISTIQRLCASDIKFKNYLFTKCQQSSRKLPLESFLILPIQRIPRYELLLDKILANTEPTHPDRGDLQKALEKIKRESKITNERIKDFQCRQIVREIEQRFNDEVRLVAASRFFYQKKKKKKKKKGLLLLITILFVCLFGENNATNRKFVKEGPLRKIGKLLNERLNCVFFLFTDCLVYGYVASNGRNDNLRWGKLIPIDQWLECKPCTLKHLLLPSTCFEIRSSQESMILCASNVCLCLCVYVLHICIYMYIY